MTTKFHGIENTGDFISEKVPTKPTWTAADEGRLIYVEDENTTYFGDSTDWVEPSGGGAGSDTTIPLWESNGDVYWDDCNNISGWTSTGGGGTYTAVDYGGRSCLKLSSSSNSISIYRVISGGFPAKCVVSMRSFLVLNTGTLPSYYAQLAINNGVVYNASLWDTDGILTGYNSNWYVQPEIGVGEYNGRWATWTFVIDSSTSGTANTVMDVYLDGIYRFTETGSGFSQTTNDGRIYPTLYSTGVSNYYIDYIKVGTDLIQINQSDTYGVNKYYKSWDNAGYSLGGNTGASASTVDKLTFSNDNNNLILSTLTSAKTSVAGSNSSTAGYAAGGESSAHTTAIDKLQFSTDHLASITSGIDSPKREAAGFESSDAGWCAGGYSSATWHNQINKLNFASETNSSITSTMSVARRNVAGCNSSTDGFIMGGATDSSYTTVDQLTFATETRTTVTGGLTTATQGSSGISAPLAGYNVGGHTGTYTNKLDKMVFAVGTFSTITSTLSTIKGYVAAFESTTDGYCTGGNSGATLTTIEKLVFSNDNVGPITSGLSSTRWLAQGFNTL